MFFVATAPERHRRPREPVAEGPRHLPHPRPAARRVPRSHRQRRRDDRAPSRERPHHDHVLRVRRRRRASRASTERGTVHVLGSPELRRARAALPGASRARARSSTSTSTASPRRAASGCRSWISSATATTCSTGPRARATTASSKYRESKNAESIDGLPGHRRVTLTRSRDRAGARAHGRARHRRGAALGRRRPAVPHRATRRCRSNGSRCSCSRATATRTSSCPASRRRGSTPQPDLFEIVPWDETDDPIAPRRAPGRAARRVAAIGDQTWARFVLDLQRALPAHFVRRASTEVVGADPRW